MSDTAFLAINGAAMLLLVAAIRAASRAESNGWVAVAIATVFLINTISHAAGAALTRSYAPGLISAVVLYVPLGSLTMIRAFDQAPRAVLVRGMIIGATVHALVLVIAVVATR